MARMAVCERNHVWALQGAHGTCPTCGGAGRPQHTPEADTGGPLDTLPPDAIPPLAPHVASPAHDLAQNGLDPLRAAFATVPGYEILRELGRGGMGVVFEAREHELKRPIALKVLRGNVRSDPVQQQRFRHEAEAVARLRHRGIVQIHAIGQHQGYPFLALEYLEGGTLADRIAGRTLLPADAARVVQALAHTMAYAHRSGIVHRDLKPANVLLAPSSADDGLRLGGDDDARFELKITDFGLAKETQGESQQTRVGAILGTPSYMAPEQARGASDQVGPAADVYALGAVLYELLTGRPPFLAETRVDTLAQVVREDPVAPTALRPALPRDLETICLKCLRKDPARRYVTAADLADDLQRFLHGEPIRARRVRWWERAWKWARRRPAEALLLAALALAGVAFITGVLVYQAWLRNERDRAEHNFRLALRAVDDLLTEIGAEHLAGEPYMEEKRRVLLHKALQFYEEFLRQKQDDRRVQLETALALRRLADVLRLLERHDEAIDAYARALTMLDSLPRDDPGVAQHEAARCLNAQGEVLRAASRFPEAETAYGRALKLFEVLARDHPGDEVHREQAETLNNLGILYRESQRPALAEAAFRSALRQLEPLVAAQPQAVPPRQHLARAHINLATVLDAPRQAEAVQAYQAAITWLDQLRQANPARPEFRHELGVACNNLGNAYAARDQLAPARTQHERARDLFQELAADFPRVLLYRQELANAWNSLGSVCYQARQFPQAIQAWEQAALLLEKLVQERPTMTAYRGDRGMVLGNIGLVHLARGQLDQARTFLQRGHDALRAALQLNPRHAIYRDTFHDHTQHLCDVLLQSHAFPALLTTVRAARQVSPDAASFHYDAARFLARALPRLRDSSTLNADQRRTLEVDLTRDALAALEHALNKGFADLNQFQTDRTTTFAPLADQPAFRDLAARLNQPAPPAPR